MASGSPLNVCMVGTGEYTTGYVDGSASRSDKSKGVVALTLIDLRARGLVGSLSLCGVRGSKFPGIREHLRTSIAEGYPASGYDMSMDTFPADDRDDPDAYISALDAMRPGDAVTIFTPDDTHFPIAMAAVERGLHVLLTKPLVKTLEHHHALFAAARRKNVLVMCEVHKRWDPIYSDARDRIRSELGAFSHLSSYMSQPKHQLHTFKGWAGRASDISYYLNSHHIDFHEWCLHGLSRPERVSAAGSLGVASATLGVQTEDTISVTAQWRNASDGSVGVALYTASWIAPPSDVHSQQRFFYMGHKGEIMVDQAHRGYSTATDEVAQFKSLNPLFMKYTPKEGKFSGQSGYGYRSIEAFVVAVNSLKAGEVTLEELDAKLPTAGSTFFTTAVLEAGRLSLDNGNRPVRIVYDGESALARPLRCTLE